MALTAREILNREYGDSKNFMTPRVIKRGKISRTIAYELSAGEGFFSKPLYGVSVVEYDEKTNKTRRCVGVSQSFHTYEDALYYVVELRDRVMETGKLEVEDAN